LAVCCALALGCSKAADPDQRRLGKARIGILTSFNEQHGTNFSDEDRIRRLIRDEIAPQVAQDQRYRNAKANTPNTAGIELDPRPSTGPWIHSFSTKRNFTSSSRTIPCFAGL
jgi:hypothetical protein